MRHGLGVAKNGSRPATRLGTNFCGSYLDPGELDQGLRETWVCHRQSFRPARRELCTSSRARD